jgi:hypothetical protein
MMKLIDKLHDGPLDIVGDVHGVYDALDALLERLGYGTNGFHPEGRKLVFVGDLVDRGPNSPAVFEKVMHLVTTGYAQCVLGNHELNLLLGEAKYGNEWFMSPDKCASDIACIETDEQKRRVLEFFAQLPVALERDDLRVVHASWNAAAIDELREKESNVCSVAELYREYREQIETRLADDGRISLYQREQEKYGQLIAFGDNPPFEHWPSPVMLPGLAEADVARQMENPIRVLTSGEERKAREPFPAAGKFRFVDRVRWWDQYDGRIPVVVGHYWRRFKRYQGEGVPVSGPDLFEGVDSDQWMGKDKNVYCVDFSIGATSKSRNTGDSIDSGSLAALRWPENVVLFDDGRTRNLRRPR